MGLKGSFQIFSRENGFYLIKFLLLEDLNKVVDEGPWMFEGKPMIIKKWEVNLKLDRDLLISLPIWVRMPHLNLSLWDEENICRITSVLGRPIRLDDQTKNLSRLNYARVLVEMMYEDTLKTKVKTIADNKETYIQDIEFEYIPPNCTQCKCFGHAKPQCPLVFRCEKCLCVGHKTDECTKVWVPKNTTVLE